MISKRVENDEIRLLPQSASSFNTHDEMKLQNAKVLGIGHLSNLPLAFDRSRHLQRGLQLLCNSMNSAAAHATH